LMNNKFDRHKNEVVGDNVNTASKANAWGI
jgi:hypothetical protein